MGASRWALAVRSRPLLVVLGACCLVAAGCSQNMADHGRIKPLEASEFFADGRSARPLPPGTVARGELHTDAHFYEGRVSGEFAVDLPLEVDMALLQRGRERYDAFCSPCHDRVGNGNGMVVQRGFRQPPSLHIERLREARVGYIFDVMTRGFGAMPSYAAQVPAADRWAIIAYIRALQRSQNATLDDVPAAQRAALEGGR